MPGIAEGKSFAFGYWDTQLCDNSLAGFPSGVDNSWGIVGFTIDGVDTNNYVEIKILSDTYSILKTIKFSSIGKRRIDLSQFSNIGTTQDIIIRIEITTWV